jgi:hypothetical protein
MLAIEIRVEEIINSKWSEWFSELEISYSEDGESIIRGEVQDQSGLYGLLAKLRDLGLTLISIKTSDLGGKPNKNA